MQIHLLEHSERTKIYFFTKNKNHCLKVDYDKDFDFGEHSTSGAALDNLKIHYKNSYIFSDKHKKITINQVPKCIIDVLTFLK